MDTATSSWIGTERDRLDSAIEARQGSRTKTMTSTGRPMARRRRLSESNAEDRSVNEERWAERKERSQRDHLALPIASIPVRSSSIESLTTRDELGGFV